MLVASCGECVYYTGETGWADCRIGRPAAQEKPGQPGVWPLVLDTGYCGEFKPRKRGEWRFPTAEPHRDLLGPDAQALIDEAQRKIEAIWHDALGGAPDQGSVTWRDTVSKVREGTTPLTRARHRAQGESVRNDAWAHEEGCPVLVHYPYDQDPIRDLTTVAYVPPPAPCTCDDPEEEPRRGIKVSGCEFHAGPDGIPITATPAEEEPENTSVGDAQDVSDLESDLHGPGFDPAAVREYARRTGCDVPLGHAFHKEHCPMSRETGARSMTGCACDLPVKRKIKPTKKSESESSAASPVDALKARIRELLRNVRRMHHKHREAALKTPRWAHEESCPLWSWSQRPRSYPEPPAMPDPECECETP